MTHEKCGFEKRKEKFLKIKLTLTVLKILSNGES